MMPLNRREVARYLGYGTHALEAEVEKYVVLCEQELCALPVRRVARRLPRAALPFDSQDLNAHLKDTTEVWLIALTLGSEADRLLRRWSVEHIGKAAVGQACAAAWMDLCCQTYLYDTLKMHLTEGEGFLPPYSPGYGDFSLSAQRVLLSLLDAGRSIGVSLTEGGMLVPEKTITAVVGIAKNPLEHCMERCKGCRKEDCKFRMA